MLRRQVARRAGSATTRWIIKLGTPSGGRPMAGRDAQPGTLESVEVSRQGDVEVSGRLPVRAFHQRMVGGRWPGGCWSRRRR